jgi:hypothetical protein
MLKRILSVALSAVLSLVFLAVMPVVSGCDDGDEISTSSTKNIEVKKTGGPVLTGD